MNKKLLTLLTSITLIIGMLILGGCTNSETPNNKAEEGSKEKSTKTVIGYYGGTCEAPIYLAKETGIYEKVGLDVELMKITQDTATLVATNKIDAVMLTPSLFKAMEQGLDIKITDGIHTGCIQGAAPKNSGIKSPADLKGKTVGVESMGGIPMIQISSQMIKAGLDPQKDVKWVVYPAPQLSVAMEKGEIDCFATWDPYAEIAVQKGAVKFFSNTFDEGLKDKLCCFVGINGKTIKEKPEVSKKITEAFALAGKYISENPLEAAKVAIDKKYTAGDIDITAKLLGDYKWISGEKEASKKSVQDLYKMLEENGVLDPQTDVTELTNKVFVDLDKK